MPRNYFGSSGSKEPVSHGKSVCSSHSLTQNNATIATLGLPRCEAVQRRKTNLVQQLSMRQWKNTCARAYVTPKWSVLLSYTALHRSTMPFSWSRTVLMCIKIGFLSKRFTSTVLCYFLKPRLKYCNSNAENDTKTTCIQRKNSM